MALRHSIPCALTFLCMHIQYVHTYFISSLWVLFWAHINMIVTYLVLSIVLNFGILLGLSHSNVGFLWWSNDSPSLAVTTPERSDDRAWKALGTKRPTLPGTVLGEPNRQWSLAHSIGLVERPLNGGPLGHLTASNLLPSRVSSTEDLASEDSWLRSRTKRVMNAFNGQNPWLSSLILVLSYHYPLSP